MLNKKYIITIITTLMGLLLISGCASLPKGYHREDSVAFQNTKETNLGREINSRLENYPGKSGFYLLSSGMESFLSRMAFSGVAERSIDVQVYIFHNDTTGKLLTTSLLDAADRGVRVRLLLDDLGTGGVDSDLVVLNSHPNCEVRLFNPFVKRKVKGIDFLGGFSRVNRRMHNKSFTIDNQVSIVGGRNIGDEYFQAHAECNFGDLDLLAIGPVVPEVSACFDAYWNCEFAVPVTALDIKQPESDSLEKLRGEVRTYLKEMENSEYIVGLKESDLYRNLKQGKLAMYYGRAKAVYDLPEKVEKDPGKEWSPMRREINKVTKGLRSELVIFSPYFIPGKSGVNDFKSHQEKGVQVRILTNSLASNDVSIVHSGYSRYRKKLLKEGIELYEFKPILADVKENKKSKGKDTNRVSLHAKAFAFDRRVVFVGSLNLDPRSIEQNTEMGILVENPELAEKLVSLFEQVTQKQAFRVRFRKKVTKEGEGSKPSGKLEWVTMENGQELKFKRDPYVSRWKIFKTKLMSFLPIESQL